MRGTLAFRHMSVLGLVGSVLLTLTACGDPTTASPADSPEKVAASFVYLIGKNKPEDALALVHISPDEPVLAEYAELEDIEFLRRVAGMRAGCFLANGWEPGTSVVEHGDHFAVTVPLDCDGKRSMTIIKITTTDSEWRDHRIIP